VLLGLRILLCRTLAGAYEVCLSADRRGIFCYSLHSRPRPFAPSTRSATARLIGCSVGSSAAADEEKEIQQEEFYEMPTDDRGSSRAGRHSERNIAFS